MRKPFIQIRSNNYIKVLFVLLVSVTVILWATKLGSVSISFGDVVKSLFHKHASSTNEIIIWEIRLPRVLVGFFVGGALSAAGMALQSLLRNPLAEPYTIGVSSGATLATVVGITLPITWIQNQVFFLHFFALIGAIVALLLVLIIARAGNRSLATESVILSGIILSAFLGAILTLLISLSKTTEVQAILGWMMGSLNGATWSDFYYVVPFITAGFIYLQIRIKIIRALSDGDASAHSLGIQVSREKTMLYVAIAGMTGAAVSVSGMIGFVGLIVPFFSRKLFRGINRSAYFICFLIGGSYLVLADLVARILISPSELPIGVVTAILGAPTFAWILIRQRREGKSI